MGMEDNVPLSAETSAEERRLAAHDGLPALAIGQRIAGKLPGKFAPPGDTQQADLRYSPIGAAPDRASNPGWQAIQLSPPVATQARQGRGSRPTWCTPRRSVPTSVPGSAIVASSDDSP
jgi:hypothetical protein